MTTISSPQILLLLLLLLLTILDISFSCPSSPSVSIVIPVIIMRDKLAVTVPDPSRTIAVRYQLAHELWRFDQLQLVRVREDAGHKPDDMADSDAEEVGDGRPAEEHVEREENKGKIDPAEAQPEHEAHVLVGVLFGPVVDDDHQEAWRQDGHFQEQCAEPEEREAHDQDPGVVGGAAKELALLELARVLVEGEHVDQEGEPEGVEDNGGEKPPELEALEDGLAEENQAGGLDEVEAVGERHA